MSDPVTNVEIEDVLSSIRRLVSDEGRTAREIAEVQPEEVAPEHDERAEEISHTPETAAPALILTPALRVAEEPAEEEQAQDESVEDVSTAEPDPLVLEWEDVAPQDEVQDEEEAAETPDEPQTDEADGSEDAPVFEFVGSPDAVETEEDEAAEAETEAFAEDEADEQTDSDEGYVEPEEALEDAAQEDAPEAGLPPQAMMDDASQGRSIEDKIAALEALIGKSESEFEPDGAEANAAAKAKSSSGLPWPEEATTTSVPDPEDASQSADFDADAIAFQAAHAAATKEAEDGVIEAVTQTLPEGLGEDSAALIDEEALRDMVADIVRQELQGPLGERITRNVRKLVRREIYRAMAANELD